MSKTLRFYLIISILFWVVSSCIVLAPIDESLLESTPTAVTTPAP